MRAPVEPVELVEIAIHHPYYFSVSHFSVIFLSGPRRSGFQSGNWYAALFSENRPRRETKSAKVFSDLSSRSSFLFVSSWLILILSERRASRYA